MQAATEFMELDTDKQPMNDLESDSGRRQPPFQATNKLGTLSVLSPLSSS